MAEGESVEIVRTARNGQAVLYEENHYRLIKTNNEKRYWRCSTSGCSCTAVTNDRDGRTFIVSAKGVHEHAPVEKKCNTLRVKQKMVQMVQRDRMSVKAAYDAVLQDQTTGLNDEHLNEAVAKLPLFDSVKSSVHRARQSVYPPVPNAMRDINFDGNLGQTIGNQRFLLNDDRVNSGIVLFASDSNVAQLCNSSTVLIDGTFRVVPSFFYQLYTIHGKCAGAHWCDYCMQLFCSLSLFLQVLFSGKPIL